jgi:hypothetical protein
MQALAALPALLHLVFHGNPLAALHHYRSGACRERESVTEKASSAIVARELEWQRVAAEQE